MVRVSGSSIAYVGEVSAEYFGLYKEYPHSNNKNKNNNNNRKDISRQIEASIRKKPSKHKNMKKNIPDFSAVSLPRTTLQRKGR
jgi:hypothetical protein